MRLSEDELSRILSGNPSLKVYEQRVQQSRTCIQQLTREDFDSDAEFHFYRRRVLPGLLTGIISAMETHKTFVVIEAVEHCGKTYRAREYTPDFVIEYADGAVEVVEVKGKQVKKMQRDYPLRRQLFIIKYCVPNRWKFIEVPAEEL